jgi:lysophospholipase L1-like esterase
MIGDSTMADYTNDSSVRPRTGWGEKFGQFFNSSVTINDVASSGRSSRSYYNETGKWDVAKAAINTGDYVIIQFGHNDQKYGTDYTQYGTYAYCNDGTTTGTCAGTADALDTNGADQSLHSYYQYLVKYVDEVRAKGGIPILMTPIVRRYFSSGSITSEGQHNIGIKGTETYARGDYPAAMKAVAAAKVVPIIDITALSKTIVEGYGASAAVTPYLYYPDDTHLNPLFATLVAKAAVDGLKSQGVLSSYMVSTPAVSINSSTLAFSSTTSGKTATDFFNLAGYDQSSSGGTLTLTAPTGFTLSTDQATWSSTLPVTYSSSAFNKTIYVQFAPTAVQSYSDVITGSTSSGTTMPSITVSGTGLAAAAGTDVYGLWSMMSASLTATSSNTALVTANSAVLSSGATASTTTGTFNSASYTVNRYLATGITAADSTRYVEFSMAPVTGYTYSVTSLSSYFASSGGAGVSGDILYSLDGFATTGTKLATVSPAATSSSVGYAMTAFSTTLTSPIAVASGKTLTIRIYPYFTNTTSTGKYLSIANFTIDGAAQ